MDIEEPCFVYEPNYEPGDLAWAKVKGYNWWPSLVCNDPGENNCIRTLNNKTQCHVQFLDARRSRAWVLAKDIKPFKGSEDSDFKNTGGKFHSKTKSILAAAVEADTALSLSRSDRLATFRLAGMGDVEIDNSQVGSASQPGGSDNVAIKVKEDPDSDEREMSPMDETGDAGKERGPLPESVLQEMKDEPPDDMEGGSDDVTVAVDVKEEMDEGHDEEEEDYSESEMETIAQAAANAAVTPEKAKKKGPRPGPKSSKKGFELEANGDISPSTSKEDGSPVGGTYKVDEIPAHMKQSFVLLSTEGVPPDASPEKPVKLAGGKGKGPKSRKGKGAKAAKSPATPKPSTAPKAAKPRAKPKPKEPEPVPEILEKRSRKKTSISYNELQDSEFDELGLGDSTMDETVDSDEDPEFTPSKGRRGGRKKKRPAESSSESESEDDSDMDEDGKKQQQAKKRAKTVSFAEKYRAKSPVEPVIPDDPAAFQPTVGEYLVDKSTVKDDLVPTIWLFKKGGIIQKYNRTEENGEVVYESAQWFSDWWDDYGDRYAVVKTQVKFKHQNKIKVTVTEWPEDLAEWAKTANETVTSSKAQEEAATSETNKENTSPAAKKSGSKNNANESEVTSTTTHGDEEFQVGRFVIDKKDLKNIDNFAIWKIESGILLKKYEMHIVKGKMMHKPVKVYRGYRDIGDFYNPVKIKRVVDLMSDYVEVDEVSRPKLSYDESMEEESEQNPLLQHFYVYMQVLLSQALEPGFLDEVLNKKEDTYMIPLGEIDKLVKQKMDQIERKLRWNPSVKAALQKCPFLREVHKPVENSVCEGLQETDETVEETIFLFGDDYDKDTLKSTKGAEGSQEFKIGKTAAKNVSNYHQLCHFKYNLYDKCQAKIKLVQESKYGAPTVEETMDACLHNKAWVLQNFADLNELIQTS